MKGPYFQRQRNLLTRGPLPDPVQPVKVAKTLWRYGLSPIFMERAVSALLDDFDRIYAMQDAGARGTRYDGPLHMH